MQTKKEWRPGSIDFVGLEWNCAYGSYYLSNGDGTYSTVAGRDTGIVMFNLEDSKLTADSRAYGTVQVRKIKSGEMEFGVKFAHTYSALILTGSASYTYKPSVQVSAEGDFSLGLSNTKNFTVNVSSELRSWTLWNDNAVKIP